MVANPALLAKNLSLEIQSINNKAQKTGLSLIIAILLLNIINSSIV
ncbi:hypothetical protein H6768_02190 [Candidatus Peribacteria bacterium]|nr:hypothetical protein [Candidatus Peribacteria bacterium]